MSLIKLFRKLSNSEILKTSIVIGLGLTMVSTCIWVSLSGYENLFKLEYIKGHTAVPISSLFSGLIMLFFGIKRLLIK